MDLSGRKGPISWISNSGRVDISCIWQLSSWVYKVRFGQLLRTLDLGEVKQIWEQLDITQGSRRAEIPMQVTDVHGGGVLTCGMTVAVCFAACWLYFWLHFCLVSSCSPGILSFRELPKILPMNSFTAQGSSAVSFVYNQEWQNMTCKYTDITDLWNTDTL